MKTKIIQNIKVIVLALVLALGVGYAYADFSLPLNLPPTCISGNPGCDAPLNVGSTPQIKSGWLEISAATTTHSLRVNTSLYDPAATGLYVWGTSTFYGNVTIVPGASSGKVLTSDASGNASWQAATGGSSGVTSLSSGTGIILSPSPITTTGSISADTNVLQKRVSTACAANQAIKSIAADGTPTCVNVVSSLTAGTGISLSPSPITTTGTISADTAAVQVRVSGSCGTNQAIKSIASNGTVTCVNLPSSALCTYGSKTYSSGAACKTQTSFVSQSSQCAALTCQSDGTMVNNWTVLCSSPTCGQ